MLISLVINITPLLYTFHPTCLVSFCCLILTGTPTQFLNTFWLRQNGHHFADNIFQFICLNENSCILIPISLKFLPKGMIDNRSALLQIMASCLCDAELLPEQWWPSLLSNIYVSQPWRVMVSSLTLWQSSWSRPNDNEAHKHFKNRLVVCAICLLWHVN